MTLGRHLPLFTFALGFVGKNSLYQAWFCNSERFKSDRRFCSPRAYSYYRGMNAKQVNSVPDLQGGRLESAAAASSRAVRGQEYEPVVESHFVLRKLNGNLTHGLQRV